MYCIATIAVALACVVAMADDKWGEVPCAFIELKDGAVADEAAFDSPLSGAFGRVQMPQIRAVL